MVVGEASLCAGLSGSLPGNPADAAVLMDPFVNDDLGDRFSCFTPAEGSLLALLFRENTLLLPPNGGKSNWNPGRVNGLVLTVLLISE